MLSVLRCVFLLLYLLLEMVLFTSAALVSEDRQRDVADHIEVPTRVSSGAADGAPQPPQNLFVDPQSADSVLLIWQNPADITDLDHYLVYVEEDMEDTTTENYYIFYNLEGCRDYTFGVMSVSAAGDVSDPLLGEEQTLADVPPAPQNLQVDGYTSTTVTLSWDKPDTLCDVEGYNVKWTTDGLDTQSNGTNEAFFTVIELSTNTTYTFTVSGFTSYGEGPEATVQQTTDVFDGGPPENLEAVAASSAIYVSWSPPADEPLYYVVSAPPCTLLEDMVFGLSYLITGLEACDTCEFYVTSYYDDTIWYTEYTRGTTDGGDPPPPESCSVQEEGDGLTVTWEKPVSECSLGVYSIYWTGTKLWGDGGNASGNGTASVTSYTVLDTVPYSQYTFEISASIDGVFGSPASCSGTSLETPASPPTELAQVEMDASSVTVQWSLPDSLRGKLLGWYLNWTSAIGHYLGEQDVTDPEQRMFQIGDLDPSEVYNVYFMAVNGAGKGELAMLEASTEYVPRRKRAGASNLLSRRLLNNEA